MTEAPTCFRCGGPLGYEPLDPELEQACAACTNGAELAVAPFTAGEKIASIVEQLFARGGASPDAKVRAAIRTAGYAHRLGLTRPLLAVLPPLDDREAWDGIVAGLVAFALNVASDGYELDLDACRAAGAELIASLYEEEA